MGYTDGFILFDLSEDWYLDTTYDHPDDGLAENGLLSWTIVSVEGFATQTVVNPINLMSPHGYNHRVRQRVYVGGYDRD